MAKKTNNYKLPKPEVDDFYDISEYNKTMDMLDDSLTEMDQKKLNKNGDASEAVTEFEEEILRDNIESGETLSSTFGKVKKWFSEMKDVAFSGHAKDVATDSVHRFVSDAEKSSWNGKVGASGGDISETMIGSLESIATEFPIPNQGETSNVFLGKVKKFMQDFNNFKTGIITVGKLANNGNTTFEGYALDARYGKTLFDLYSKLNSDLSSLTTPIPLTDTASINLDSGLFVENKIYFHTISSERPKNTKGFPADAYGYGALITGKHNYAWLSFQIYIPHNNATNAGCPIYFRTFADTAANNLPIWRYIEAKMVQANT
ncbi:hypothetical protein [Lacrimispora aerotolerans]|uniref:hypothetical protein n=1 Tax=Lacrimispora aerotolerans TaxID=36832 RepID=UPI00068D2EA1|nr:hypothetical protein [Lacrimispora aerotolerans]